MYYQQTTYKHDYNKSPRGQPSYGDSSPRGGYYPDGPRGDQRYFREAPRERVDREPNRSPHHSPRSPRRGYDGFSPAPVGPPINPRGYPHYDRSREDLPPFNTYAINSTTQHDYGDFTQKQQIVNDIRARADAELARRYEKQYENRPYFDDKDLPSFYKNMPQTDRSGYDMGRRAPRYDGGPLTDRSERDRRPPSLDHRSPPPGPNNAFEDMSRGQIKKELDRIELHDGNFKPYSHHNSGGGGPGVLSRPILHHEHRFEDNLMKTTSPRRSQDAGVLSRQIEDPEHRFESNLVETNHPRQSKDAGVLSRQIEDPEHRFESNLVETNNLRPSKGPGVLSRPIEHHEHRFESNLVETNNPRRSTDPGVLPRQVEHSEHRFENNILESNYPRQSKIMHRKENQEGTGVGVFLIIRTDEGGFFDVKRAFDLCSGETPERKLLGFATSKMIDVKEGGDGWKRLSVIARWNGKSFVQERRGDVDKMMVINWFKGEKQAREWVDRDREFKHSNFPMPYGNQVSILPLKYRPSSGYQTFMVMEFNNITDMQELHRYIDFMSRELERYRVDIGFIDTKALPVKSSLFNPNSHILCHMFCDKNEANLFFSEVASKWKFQHADMTTMVFELLDITKK